MNLGRLFADFNEVYSKDGRFTYAIEQPLIVTISTRCPRLVIFLALLQVPNSFEMSPTPRTLSFFISYSYSRY